MATDVFGNLRDWGVVLDRIEELAQTGRLDRHQADLARVLRFRDNWRLREAVLECLPQIGRPEPELLDVVGGIMADETSCYDQRILAADSLGRVLAGRQSAAFAGGEVLSEIAQGVVESMQVLIAKPQPPVFGQALRRALAAITNAQGSPRDRAARGAAEGPPS